MGPHKSGRRTAALAALLALAGLSAGAPATAASPADPMTDSLQVTVGTSSPEQGVPVTLTFAGSAAATTGGAGAPTVYADARPAGGLGCQASYEADQSALGSVSPSLLGGGVPVHGAFTLSDTTLNPSASASYLVCAWIEHTAADTHQSVVTGAASTTFSAHGPQVSALTVSVPSPPAGGIAFQIAYTTQTDEPLTLESMIKPTGGLPCAASFELEQQRSTAETASEVVGPDVSGSDSVFGGPATLTAIATEPAGSYVVCTWVEGPSAGEVDAAISTPLTVSGQAVAPPPPSPPAAVPPAAAKLRLVSESASRRHGVALRGTAAATLRGVVTVSASCAGAPLAVIVPVGAGRFQAHLRLPGRCRSAHAVRVTVTWRGSSAFSRQTVSRSIAIRR